MPEKVYQIEVVTPMFLYGADQNVAELRVPSIKGQLRWWWRAQQNFNKLADLKENENEIFGSTKNRSSFSIVLEEKKTLFYPKRTKSIKNHRDNREDFLFIYLAYGVYDTEARCYDRKIIKEGSIFQLTVRSRDENIINEVNETIITFIKYGGLGAKSRNGFGSMNLIDGRPSNGNFESEKKNYPAFSKDAELFEFKKHRTWQQALTEIGKTYKEARGMIDKSKKHLIAEPYKKPDNRCAKQLFLHVNKVHDKFQGQILYLPYQYPNENAEYDKVVRKMKSFIREMVERRHY